MEKPVFEKGNADWLIELPSVTKQDNFTIHGSTKTTLIQTSRKKNEKEV